MEGFDPESPPSEDLPAVGDYFAAGHPATEEAIANLRDLSPPAEMESNVDALVSALEQELESARAQASAAQAADVEAFTGSLEGAASSQQAVEEASDELGTGSCAF